MHIDFFTLFPEMASSYLGSSIIGRAQESRALLVVLHNIRDYAKGRHRVTDDTPYGGGGGMVMKPDPIFEAVESVLGSKREGTPVILMTPQGRLFSQAVARELSGYKRIALIAARYEGVDERVRQYLATDEISIGDYVLTGGELPALTVIDAVTRLLPGVLGDDAATEKDSYGDSGLLEHPHYTRPMNYRGWRVPDTLGSVDHNRVELWRRQHALRRTWKRRPDLFDGVHLSDLEKEWLAKIVKESEADETKGSE